MSRLYDSGTSAAGTTGALATLTLTVVDATRPVGRDAALGCWGLRSRTEVYVAGAAAGSTAAGSTRTTTTRAASATARATCGPAGAAGGSATAPGAGVACSTTRRFLAGVLGGRWADSAVVPTGRAGDGWNGCEEADGECTSKLAHDGPPLKDSGRLTQGVYCFSGPATKRNSPTPVMFFDGGVIQAPQTGNLQSRGTHRTFVRPKTPGHGTIAGVGSSSTTADSAEEPSVEAAPAGGERTRARALLGLLVGCFALFSVLAVPRLTNNLVGDLELTGWAGPIAERVAHGDAPYVDFVLPIPPGSFAILALVQKIAGRAILLQELWLLAICQLAMALLAYVIVRPFTSRQISILVAFASLVTLLTSPRECAFDHTAQLTAWGSIAFGVHALVAVEDRRRRWLFAAAGLAATGTFIFKQSTASGVVSGWLGAFAYLALAGYWSKKRSEIGVRSRDLSAWILGAVGGGAVLTILLHVLGSSLSAYRQAVLEDAVPLVGGSRALWQNLMNSTMGSESFPSSLVIIAIVSFMVLRLSEHDGLRPSAGAALGRRDSIAIAAIVLVVFGSASILLAARVERLPDALVYYGDRLRHVPNVGLFFVSLYFVTHLGLGRGEGVEPASGHRQNAILIVAALSSLLHNLSAPTFHPFYDNNPIIPLAFLYLFIALERAALPKLKLVVFALAIGALFSTKLDRQLQARTWVGHGTDWAGMRVNPQGVDVVQAAFRVQELAGPDETVLVLPEDLELVALIDRPRPPLLGAIVFVDQYPDRLAEHDIQTLEKSPPKVIVIRPRDRTLWRQMFPLSQSQVGAARVTEAVLDRLLPQRYTLDRSVVTRFGNRAVPLEIWVRKE